ncbi:hypothetical protein DdX_18266 [Ditylenchus destructor]|uniref:Uncharacterized protein n=1 Tax=Ditylenchus destructor TaxID=166010 RepID=A0AAD4MPV6_9BILA|nr:hypothetical protein DdX_18266 [Ditylenchus destructor]
MRPYLLGSVRIRNFGINITKIPYTCADIATLESISHIWAGQSMCLWISNEAQESIQKIFRSHSILKCRELLIDSEHVDVKFYQYSSVYNLEAVYYNRLIKNDDLVDIIMNKAVYPESNTIIDLLALRDTDVLEAIEETRNRFLESPVSFCFRIAIHVILPVEDPGQLAFETRNERTKKMLKLEYVTGEEANERFGMSLFPNPALIFEQVPI